MCDPATALIFTVAFFGLLGTNALLGVYLYRMGRRRLDLEGAASGATQALEEEARRSARSAAEIEMAAQRHTLQVAAMEKIARDQERPAPPEPDSIGEVFSTARPTRAGQGNGK